MFSPCHCTISISHHVLLLTLSHFHCSFFLVYSHAHTSSPHLLFVLTFDLLLNCVLRLLVSVWSRCGTSVAARPRQWSLAEHLRERESTLALYCIICTIIFLYTLYNACIHWHYYSHTLLAYMRIILLAAGVVLNTEIRCLSVRFQHCIATRFCIQLVCCILCIVQSAISLGIWVTYLCGLQTYIWSVIMEQHMEFHVTFFGNERNSTTLTAVSMISSQHQSKGFDGTLPLYLTFLCVISPFPQHWCDSLSEGELCRHQSQHSGL